MVERDNNKLFLFLGTTGTQKEVALSRLGEWAQTHGRPKPLQIDFENRIEELYGPGLLFQYLDQPNPSHQIADWEEAFNQVSGEVKQERKRKDIYLAIHGALLRKDYGVRSPIIFEKIASLKPDAIITLIDDVFVNWHYTELRASGGQDHKGTPTLAQLLIGRRHEILIADLLTNFLEYKFSRPRKPNYVLALRHSVETLGRLLYGDNITKVYVSFPISKPRRKQQQKNCKAMNEVNDMLKQALEFQKNNKNLVLFLPVTIDEMLIANIGKTASDKKEDALVKLKLSSRWPIPEVLGLTLRNEDALPDIIQIPAWQIDAIDGLINDEIRTHDFRMIDQSQKVLVLSKYCEKEKSSGVSAEIDYSVTCLRRVEAYQVSNWLPAGMNWASPSGTGPFAEGTVRAEYVGYHTCLEDALNALLNN